MSGSEPLLIRETSEWIVLDKPAGWLSITGRSGRDDRPVLFEWAKKHHGQLWVVHRLDVETSGVILFARSEEAHRRANQWFENQDVKKRYECLTMPGTSPTAPVFKVQTPIEGKPSVTQFEVREKFSAALLVSARPMSGRRHQIRIHLAEKGLPILGDLTYGGPRQVQEITVDRVALHACELNLPTGERFEAPRREDFESWLETLRKSS